jgi:hypothetical protein
MDYRTIEQNFDYQMEEVLEKMEQEALENDENFNGDYVWKNRERLGELVFEAIDAYCGVDELINKIKEL